MGNDTSCTSHDTVRLVLSAALNPFDESHASCHRQILRQLECAFDDSEEDADRQAMLLSSLGREINCLSEEKHIHIIRAALSLIDSWTDRCPASLSIKVMESVGYFLTNLTFIAPERFHGCSLLRLVRLHLAVLSPFELCDESGEYGYGFMRDMVDSKARVLMEAAVVILEGCPMGEEESAAILTSCIGRLAEGPTSSLSVAEGQTTFVSSKFRLLSPYPPRFTLSRTFMLPYSMDFVASQPSVSESDEGWETLTQVDANRLYLSLTALVRWGDAHPQLQAPILKALTDEVVMQEFQISGETQHESGDEEEAEEETEGLPHWAEQAMKCVEWVETESAGVGISGEGFRRLLTGLGRRREADEYWDEESWVNDEVLKNNARIALAIWLAVALSCARRWCCGKESEDIVMEALEAHEEVVPQDDDTATDLDLDFGIAGVGAPQPEDPPRIGKKRKTSWELPFVKKTQLWPTPKCLRHIARQALISTLQPGFPVHNMRASQTLLVWGLGAQPGSAICSKVINDWILTGLKDPNTPSSTCHLALKVTEALLGWDFGRPAESAAAERVEGDNGGEGGGVVEGKSVKKGVVSKGRRAIGSMTCRPLRFRKTRMELCKEVWEAVKVRVGDELQEVEGEEEVEEVGGEGVTGVLPEDVEEEEAGWAEEGGGQGSGMIAPDSECEGSEDGTEEMEEEEEVEEEEVEEVGDEGATGVEEVEEDAGGDGGGEECESSEEGSDREDEDATEAAERDMTPPPVLRRSLRRCHSRYKCLQEATLEDSRDEEWEAAMEWEDRQSFDPDLGAGRVGAVAKGSDSDDKGKARGEYRNWAEVDAHVLNLVLRDAGSRSLLTAAGVCRHWRATAGVSELWKETYERVFLGLPRERPRRYKHHKRAMSWKDAFISRLRSKRGDVTCDHCGKSFSKVAKTSLRAHKAWHVKRNALPHECPFPDCDIRYDRIKHVKRHLKAKEAKAGHGFGDLSPYLCSKCPTLVLEEEEMRQHKRMNKHFD